GPEVPRELHLGLGMARLRNVSCTHQESGREEEREGREEPGPGPQKSISSKRQRPTHSPPIPKTNRPKSRSRSAKGSTAPAAAKPAAARSAAAMSRGVQTPVLTPRIAVNPPAP